MIRGVPRPLFLRGFAFIVVALFVLDAASAALHAQSTSASLSGTVYDSTRAVLSDATVTVRHEGTSLVRQSTSDASGAFRLTSLPPGPYEVTIKRTGFKTERSEVLLLLGEDRRLEVMLSLDSHGETVDVSTKAAAIDTSSTTLERRITGAEASELPVPGRLFLQLATLTPGIVGSYNTGPSGSGFAAAGQTGQNNSQFIDGLALDDAQTSSPRGSVPLEAI